MFCCIGTCWRSEIGRVFKRSFVDDPVQYVYVFGSFAALFSGCS
jgi:hypothetical protein